MDSVITSLHEAGLVEIQDISERLQQDAEWKQILKPSHTSQYTGKISSLLMKTTGTVDFLKSVRRKDFSIPKLVMSFLNPPPIEKVEVDNLSTQELIKKADETLGKVDSVTKPKEDQLNRLDSEKNKFINAKKVAENLSNFDINLADLQDSEHVNVISGKIAIDSYDKLIKSLNDLTDELAIFDQDAGDKISKLIIIVTLKKYGDDVSNILRKMEFEKFDIPSMSGKPSEIISKSESEIESIDKQKESISNDLADISAQWLDTLIALNEELKIERQRCEISSSFGETEKTVMFESWVPAKDLDETLEIIESSTEGHSIIDVSDPDVENDKIPSKLDNPRWAKPYEMFVHMYSPPDYREFDPTIFMAIIFPFFFGFCLTESGYGLADAIIGLLIFRGLGRSSKLMSNFGLILFACGVWAIIMGGITNSFLGDFYPRFILGNPNLAIPTTINAVNAFVFPQNVLALALIVGIIHINMGLIWGTYNNVVRGAIADALGTQVPWFFLEAGIAIAAIFYILGNTTLALFIGGPVALVGIGLLMYFNGVFGVMDISGFLGTILSYARLLALCLSTGGIATTVNILAQLSYDIIPVIGFILAPIIFVLGQVANGAFQTLGAFINSLRLHYVEYFAQFYIGGSAKFKAFRTKRRFTDIRR